MIEHRRGDLLESILGVEDAEYVRHNRIDGRGFAEGPRKFRGVVASQGRCLLGRGGAAGDENGLLEDQRRQFEVRVSDGSFCVGEAEHLLGDVGWTLYVPGVVLAVFAWVYPDPPGAQAQSVGVAEVRCGPSYQLPKVGGVVCHINTQVAP